MDNPGNVIRLAERRRREKPAQRAIAPEPASQYVCLRCETDRFRLYASGMIHCAHCGALMRNLLVAASPQKTGQ